jgi:hypothetical protein
VDEGSPNSGYRFIAAGVALVSRAGVGSGFTTDATSIDSVAVMTTCPLQQVLAGTITVSRTVSQQTVSRTGWQQTVSRTGSQQTVS